jgi:hypothetical protein
MLEGRRLRAALTALLLSSAALFAIGVAKERHDIKKERARAVAATTPSPPKTTPKPTTEASTTTAESAPTTTGTGESGAQHAADGTASKPSKQDAGSGESAAKRKSEGTGTRTTTVAAATGESAAKRKSENTGTQATTATSTTGESAARLASEHGGESAAHLRSEGSNEQVFGINTESIPLVAAAVAISVLFAIALWLAPGLSVLLLAVVGLGIVSAVFDVREAAHQATENRGALEAIAIIVASLHLAAAALAGVMLRKSPRRTAAAI